MKELLEEFNKYIKFWHEKSPSQVNKFLEFLKTIKEEGVLDKKTKELIAVAVAVAAQCKWCIAFHVNEALKAGAKPEEIREAGWVAVLMGGGPKLAYMQLLEKAIEEFTK